MVEERSGRIRVDTTLVQINVTVTDPLNRFVTGLEKEHFRLFEDKIEQKILDFSSEDAPLSIGLVFDTSGSMGPKLQKSRQAAVQFFKTANPEDEFFLIEFNDRPELVVPFTPDTDDIQNRLEFAQSKGKTALLDGVYMAMNQMKKARNPRKAILIISDGGDNNSRYTESEIKNAVREADVQIYGIGIFEPIGSRGRTPEELMGPEPVERSGRADRRPQLQCGESERTCRHRRKNRNRTSQSIRALLQLQEPGAGRQVSSRQRQAGAAARPSAAQGVFPPRVLCAFSVVSQPCPCWLLPACLGAKPAAAARLR